MNDKLIGKKVLVTGATGLIGQALVRELLRQGVHVLAAVRNIKKAERTFRDTEHIEFIVSDITEIANDEYGIDYIIHAASITASAAFVQDPVGVIQVALSGTQRVLEIAKTNHVESMVYLSSMEVYGTPETDEKISELHGTNLNTMVLRSSYPESKRMCESLCAAYWSQYGVPVKVVRLTQTFGPGVQYEDGRVFAEFARCAIENRDIILHTKGETKRSYLHIDDAVSAILTVLLKGSDGEAYNAANEESYCSIYEMARLVADKCAEGRIKVRIEEKKDLLKFGYAPTLHMNLDTAKLKQLGWKAERPLKETYQSMIDDMKTNHR